MMSVEPLQTALSCIRTLRSNVGVAFEALGNGIRADHGEEGKETKFLFELQDLLTVVNNNLRDVEQSINNLQPPHNPFNLGNSGFLSHEYAQDRQALYSQLVQSYKWTDKVHEYCNLAHAQLSQNSLTRSYTNTSQAKRRKIQTSSHNVLPIHVDKVINQIDRLLPEMNVNITRPFASNVVLHVSVGRVLKATIAFKGLLIEWIIVKGFLESLDLWTESRYKVFRKVTENAHAASMRFYMPTMPDVSVKNFLTWLHSFNTLFSDACKGCGLHLRNAMPPTWREFRTLEPYHEECKP
ncbi:Mediator of RNA polymerase II transcription subunit 27 [Frankliniella fusca]|uniref:Mediator of RNA polymerase II transcription subunit 27 n=1 Tax=Frankliniella fusca TaxID=407009 RepID=A0AAE1LHY1_9NEOP|nr:Mediator of RNA polymerase II transcription subunit 27 [Frankliniella fusca]